VPDITMEALQNLKLVEAARGEAQQLVAADPALLKHPALRALSLKAEAEIHPE
jgi:hypothetical protein